MNFSKIISFKRKFEAKGAPRETPNVYAGVTFGDGTLGRINWMASFSVIEVDSPGTIAMVKNFAKTAWMRGLKTTMSGSVNASTVALLHQYAELRDLIVRAATARVGELEARF